MNKTKQSINRSEDRNQSGVASIVIVSIIVVLISLVSIGFSRLVSRDLSSSTEDQKATAALYAAESGINDVIKYLKTGSQPYGKNFSSCQNGLQASLNTGSASLSGNNNATYNCVLVNTQLSNLDNDKIDPQQSWVTRLDSPKPFNSIFFDWTLSGGTPSFSNCTNLQLTDESTWSSSNCAPVLRLTLYSIDSQNDLSGPNFFAKTVFLYPVSSGGIVNNTIDYTNVQDGAILPINCGINKFGNYNYQTNGPSSSYCGTVFNNLTNSSNNGSYYYARVTPIYASVKVDIQAQAGNSGQSVQFNGAQALIDITATSNDVAKRLQARVSLSSTPANLGPSNIPEYALSSSGTICKRYVISSTGVTIDAAPNDCSTNTIPPSGPGLPVAITRGYGPCFGSSGLCLTFFGGVIPNDSSASYYFNYGLYSPVLNNWSGTPSQSPASPGNPINVNQGNSYTYQVSTNVTFSNFKYGSTYGYQVCAFNPVNSGGQPVCGKIATFVIQQPPPSSSTSSSGGSSSSSSGGSGSCSGVKVSSTDETFLVESFVASGNCNGAASVKWTWSAVYPAPGCGDTAGNGNSATVDRSHSNNGPGTIHFYITGYDSGGNVVGSATSTAPIDIGDAVTGC